jgi:hypothetical protein
MMTTICLLALSLVANAVRVAVPDQVDSPATLVVDAAVSSTSRDSASNVKYPVLCSTSCGVTIRSKRVGAPISAFRIGILVVRPSGSFHLQPRIVQPVARDQQGIDVAVTVQLDRLVGEQGAALVWLYLGEIRLGDGSQWTTDDNAVASQLMAIRIP